MTWPSDFVNDFGNGAVAGAYFVIGFGLIFVAYFAATRRGLLRLNHPLIWLLAAMFFVGCGGNMAEMVIHNVNDTPMHFDTFHHQAFTLMQFFGAIPFVIACRSFWKRLSGLDLSRRR